MGEYARLLGCSPGPASRRISNLGEFMRDMSPGFGLVETHRDPRDRRLITVKPSAKGTAIAEKVRDAMERLSPAVSVTRPGVNTERKFDFAY